MDRMPWKVIVATDGYTVFACFYNGICDFVQFAIEQKD